MIVSEKTNHDSIGAYAWHKYQEGELDLMWANDSEYACATFGRWGIDPHSKTVYKFSNENDACLWATMASTPGSEDYLIVSTVVDGDSIFVAYRNPSSQRHRELVACGLRWEDLGPDIYRDMEREGVFGGVYLDYSWQPELVQFNEDNILEEGDWPVPEKEWNMG